MRRVYLLIFATALIGCRSAKPPAPVPAPVAIAQRDADQAAKLTAAGNWSGAAGSWERAVSDYRLLNDRTNEAIALHNLGEAREQLGDLDAARRLLEEASAINSTLKADDQWWRNQVALLQVEAKANETNALRERFERLDARSGNLKNNTLRALYVNERGLWHSRNGDYQKAGSDLAEALRFFQAANNNPGIAAVVANQALLLERQANFQAAAGKWKEALTRFEGMANPLGIAISMLGRGRSLQQAKQNLEEARGLLERASRNFRVLHQESEAREADELLQSLKAI
jgi:tetratricopeptide (TPR) repeat protein